MRLSRREFLSVSGLAGATLLFPSISFSMANPDEISLLVFDSRLAGSVEFANKNAAEFAETLDVAVDSMSMWRQLRKLDAARYPKITGLTNWSSLVQFRGCLQEQGKRLYDENRLNSAVSNEPDLFLWQMA